MQDDEKLIYSKSETIGVAEQRKLLELGRTLNRMLTVEEFTKIVIIYNGCIDRLMKESGEVLE